MEYDSKSHGRSSADMLTLLDFSSKDSITGSFAETVKKPVQKIDGAKGPQRPNRDHTYR